MAQTNQPCFNPAKISCMKDTQIHLQLKDILVSIFKLISGMGTKATQTFTATAGQTVFTLDNAALASQHTFVFVNGVLVAATVVGKTVTLASGASVGNSVIVKYSY